MNNGELIEALNDTATELSWHGFKSAAETMCMAAERLRSQVGAVPAGWKPHWVHTLDEILGSHQGKTCIGGGCMSDLHEMRALLLAAPPSPAADERVPIPREALLWLFGLHEDAFDWPNSDRLRYGFRSEFARRAGIDVPALAARKADVHQDSDAAQPKHPPHSDDCHGDNISKVCEKCWAEFEQWRAKEKADGNGGGG